MIRNLQDLFVRQNLITEEQMVVVREMERREPDLRVDKLLLHSGFVTEEDLLKTLAHQMEFAYVELGDIEPDPEALRRTPAKYVFKNKVYPISLREEVLVVATSEPFDILSLDELEAITGLTVEPSFALAEEIAKQIKLHYGVGGETIGDMVGQKGELGSPDDLDGAQDEEEMAQAASVIRLVNEILSEAVRERASDIHIEPGEDGLAIRHRIDGVLQNQSLPSEIHHFRAAIASRLKIMAKLNIAEKRKPQDGRIQLRIDGREIDLRVSIIPMLHGEGIVIRILDKGKMVYDLQKIGMDTGSYGRFSKLIKLPHGIILVTGPTGSGKSTTLYSALAEIKDEATKIITVEDPVEYQMAGISQIQVNHKVGLDFAAGLRSILRHDPDVVLIGEVRDFETAQIATQAAMTGHLVFSTLHTNDAASAFPRLIDMGIEPYLVSSTVVGIMAQRLVRVNCPQCSTPVPAPAEPPPDFPADHLGKLYAGDGCENCRFTGYAGRMGIYELLATSSEIQHLVVGREDSNRIKRLAVDQGMRTLRQSGWELALSGRTTIEEIMRVTKDEETQAPRRAESGAHPHLPTDAAERPMILSVRES